MAPERAGGGSVLRHRAPAGVLAEGGSSRRVCRAAAWLELAGRLGVAGPGGSAELSLAPPRLRDKARVLAVVSATVAAVVGAIGVGLALWRPVTLPALAVWAAVLFNRLMAALDYLVARCGGPHERVGALLDARVSSAG